MKAKTVSKTLSRGASVKKLLKSKRFWASVAAVAAGAGLIVSGDHAAGIRAVVSAILQAVGQ